MLVNRRFVRIIFQVNVGLRCPPGPEGFLLELQLLLTPLADVAEAPRSGAEWALNPVLYIQQMMKFPILRDHKKTENKKENKKENKNFNRL